MNFLDTWRELEEIYQADFNSTGIGDAFKGGKFVGPLYHFYEDLADILNSLKHGIIYSTKNDKAENPSQFDFSLDGDNGDGRAYICMTNTLAGKSYMVNKFNRTYGISFKADSLNKLLETNVIAPYSAFAAKGNYTNLSKTTNKDGSPRKKTNPTLLAATAEQGSNPFYIYSIGQLEDDLFFVCGGQGTSSGNRWSGQTFNDPELYKALKSWFQRNIREGDTYQKYMYYHFKDGKVLGAHQEKSLYPIMARYNLNKYYKPRADKSLDKEGKVNYNSTISFRFKGPYKNTFKEVFGYGPINATDANGNELLTLDYVNPNAQGGYKGPLLFGMNIDDQTFAKRTSYFKARSTTTHSPDVDDDIPSTQTYMLANEKLFQKLSALFNENEYRIYMNDGRDFKFSYSDIESIVLPEAVRLVKYQEVINLRKLIYCVENNIPVDTTNDESLMKAFIVLPDSFVKSIKLSELNDDADISKLKFERISDYAKVLVNNLYTILSEPAFDGAKVSYELVPTGDSAGLTNIIKTKANLNTFLQSGELSNGVVDSTGVVKSGDHSRKVLSVHDLPMEGTLVDGQNNEKTIVGPVVIPGIKSEDSLARLGSEVILVAKDANNNKYVLFVYKSKSSSFMELPGGGFDSKIEGKTAYEDLLKDKLLFKCNIPDSDISSLTDTGEALILHEKGVAKDKNVTWSWSYYRLFTAFYKPELTGDDLATLSYTYDNNAEAARRTAERGTEVHGYRAHLRWVPVDGIELNRAITDRYSNLIPAIKAVANKF